MNALVIAVAVMALYLIAYHTYGKFLARRLFGVDPEAKCPSERLYDGVDYVPTNKMVLFGHHFTSIAGTGPIVGPAIALIWGWVPALLWIVFGSIFMGAVHDFGSMMVSLRHEGRSIGDLAGSIISPRVRLLFMLIIFFTLWIVIAIFGVVIAKVFLIFPESVGPVWLQLPIAVWLGVMVYRKNRSPLLFGLLATALMYLTIVLGSRFPLHLPAIGGVSPVALWVVILLVYAYVASTLPVTVLLQPRDYINAFQLCVAMLLLLLGVAAARPAMVAPPVQLHPAGAPPLMPLLFITIACGAISGFHSLVASGTSSKQCDRETDALPIAYGGMLLEGLLAVIVLIACGAGLGLGLEKDGQLFTGSAAFSRLYGDWSSMAGLGPKIEAFVTGAANMVERLGVPRGVTITLMGVFVASFAATTLDTATRIQRYIVSELAAGFRVPVLKRKHPATAVAVGSALLLAFSSGQGTGAMTLWPLFGALNQLLAGLALLVVTVWLARRRAPVVYTALPMIFMVAMTAWAMGMNLHNFFLHKERLLFTVGLVILVLQIWMVIEGGLVLFRLARRGEEAA